MSTYSSIHLFFRVQIQGVAYRHSNDILQSGDWVLVGQELRKVILIARHQKRKSHAVWWVYHFTGDLDNPLGRVPLFSVIAHSQRGACINEEGWEELEKALPEGWVEACEKERIKMVAMLNACAFQAPSTGHNLRSASKPTGVAQKGDEGKAKLSELKDQWWTAGVRVKGEGGLLELCKEHQVDLPAHHHTKQVLIDRLAEAGLEPPPLQTDSEEDNGGRSPEPKSPPPKRLKKLQKQVQKLKQDKQSLMQELALVRTPTGQPPCQPPPSHAGAPAQPASPGGIPASLLSAYATQAALFSNIQHQHELDFLQAQSRNLLQQQRDLSLLAMLQVAGNMNPFAPNIATSFSSQSDKKP